MYVHVRVYWVWKTWDTETLWWANLGLDNTNPTPPHPTYLLLYLLRSLPPPHSFLPLSPLFSISPPLPSLFSPSLPSLLPPLSSLSSPPPLFPSPSWKISNTKNHIAVFNLIGHSWQTSVSNPFTNSSTNYWFTTNLTQTTHTKSWYLLRLDP